MVAIFIQNIIGATNIFYLNLLQHFKKLIDLQLANSHQNRLLEPSNSRLFSNSFEDSCMGSIMSSECKLSIENLHRGVIGPESEKTQYLVSWRNVVYIEENSYLSDI